MGKLKTDDTENPKTDDIKTPESEETESGEEHAGGVNVASIASSLVDEMPEVQPHAIEEHESKERAKKEEHAELVDVQGQPFDPAIHKTDASGNPTLSTKGKLIRKPGRKPGKAATDTKSVIGGTGNEISSKDAQERQKVAEARSAGAMSANLLIGIGIAVGGDEWQPRVDEKIGLNEKTYLETAFADYFEATGKTDIPPGIALTVAIGGYALPRFAMPKTKERGNRFVKWIKQKWIDRKLKKHGLKSQRVEKEKSDDKAELAA